MHFSVLLGTLAVMLLRNICADKSKTPGQGVIRTGEGINQAGEGAIATSQGQGIIRAGQDF